MSAFGAKKTDRRETSSTAASVHPARKVAFIEAAENVKALKSLCDEGAITQEEFDRKKKQILDL